MQITIKLVIPGSSRNTVASSETRFRTNVTSRRPEIVSFYCWWLKSCISKISGGSMIFFYKHQLDFQPSTALIPLWLQPVTVRGTTLRDVHVLQRGEGHVTISLSRRKNQTQTFNFWLYVKLFFSRSTRSRNDTWKERKKDEEGTPSPCFTSSQLSRCINASAIAFPWPPNFS